MPHSLQALQRERGESLAECPHASCANTHRCNATPWWVVPGVAGSPDDEVKIKAKLAGFEAKAVVEARGWGENAIAVASSAACDDGGAEARSGAANAADVNLERVLAG